VSRASEQFSMNLPIVDANAACQSRVASLGWGCSLEGPNHLVVSVPSTPKLRNRSTIKVRLEPVGEANTTITLDGMVHMG
jgi:hypothetical protein